MRDIRRASVLWRSRYADWHDEVLLTFEGLPVYFVIVGLQTILLPLASGAIQLAVSGGDPILVFGMWWVFWGVGTRLLLAGIVQLIRPDATVRIMGSESASVAEKTVTRELAQANIAFGLSGSLALVPDWWPIAGFAGAAYLFFAFLGHIRNRGKNAQEQFALWTDAIVAVAVILTGVYAVITHAAL